MGHFLLKLESCSVIFKQIRCLQTTNIVYTQRKVMKKLLSGGHKKKHKYVDAPLLETTTALTKGAFEGARSSNTKRVNVLNKLFMKHITDLVTSGDYSSQFLEQGIEINRVKVTPDYQFLHVYWLTRQLADEKIVNDLLNAASGYIRHELTQLRVMGMVPKIKFIKDKNFLQLLEIDSRLQGADFGEEFEPTDLTFKLQTELQLNTVLDSNIKEKIMQLDKGEQIDEDIDDEIPEMPQNVLGVNHAAILDRVLKAVNKSKAIHRLEKNESPPVEHEINEDSISFASKQLQRKAFRDFLIKQQLMKVKSTKQDGSELLEVDDSDEMYLQHLRNMKDDISDDYLKDEDYIDEYDEGDEKK